MIDLKSSVLWRILILFSLLYFSVINASHAVIETYEFSNSSLEQRYKKLSAELRCPKCQNQNIADSNAPISQDLRKLLYKQLEAGASDEEILEFMVSRYGEFVRYKPRYGGVTMILWLMPIVLLVGAIVIALLVVRSSRRTGQPISPEEQQKLEAMLATSGTAAGVESKTETSA